MSRGLSVVRYQYSVAQVLSEILRDDLHSSDDDDDDELLHDVSESDVECSVGVGHDDVPVDSVTGCDDANVEC